MDNGKVTALTLLDLSAAFDTIDHLILLQCLHQHLAFLAQLFSGSNHIFQTYQSINISGALSCPQHHGPVLFSLYDTTSLSQVITNHNLSHHLYVGNTQVYISLSQSNAQESVSSLSDCLTDILFWMESSKLKLNPDKTRAYFFEVGERSLSLPIAHANQ